MSKVRIPRRIIYRDRKSWRKNCVVKNGCWIWDRAILRIKRLGHVNEYGLLHDEDTNGVIYAHRFAYRLFHGKIPSRHNVSTRCGNTLCVHPKHVYAITHSSRMRQKWKDPKYKKMMLKVLARNLLGGRYAMQ
jgi:hypothetical protein